MQVYEYGFANDGRYGPAVGRAAIFYLVRELQAPDSRQEIEYFRSDLTLSIFTFEEAL
jgi:hypothetical protein